MTISNEAIEAAADAAEQKHEAWGSWEDVARAALEAAAGIIRAECLEEAADELARLKKIGATPYEECTPDEREDYSVYVHDNHENFLRARAVAERGRQ